MAQDAQQTAGAAPRRYVNVNGVEIEYESFGDPSAPPLLLIMGLGTQMIAWDDAFVARLVERGFHVIRFDNRDCGLSSRMDALPMPSTLRLVLWKLFGVKLTPPYLLADMAKDTLGLMDALGLGAAHVMGVSMGGMIAQELALRHPERVLTLTSVMSTTGDRTLPPPSKEAERALTRRRPARTREEAIQMVMDTFRVIGSPGFPADPETLRARAARSYDRAYNPRGFLRQLLAVLGSPPRQEALARLKLPALVIHGKADPLVPVACGLATHRAIPGSELLLIDGMGHDLPEPVWPRIIDAVTALAARVSPSLGTARAAAP